MISDYDLMPLLKTTAHATE